MTIVHVPQQQPNSPAITTVREYLLDPKAPWQIVGVHDGWRPLCIRSLEHALIVVAAVNTGRVEEAEVFRLLLPGDDIDEIQRRESVTLTFLGGTYDGRYLFLDLPTRPVEAPHPGRRIGRLDLEDELDKGS